MGIITAKKQKIVMAQPGSPAARAGIRAGDTLLLINGEQVIDLVDYEFLTACRRLVLTLLDAEGMEREVIIRKREEEPLGLCFERDLLGTMRTCANQCMFCFIDQMPRDVRSSLLVKDDDWRMSFIMGNYVTLTNVTDRELERIIARKVSPLYISVQTTHPELRCKMLSNPRAGNIMDRLIRLKEGGICFHCQVVCCPGVNDGTVLDRTLEDLYGLWPAAQSVALIPVGITRFREGLAPIRGYEPQEASRMIDRLEAFQDRSIREHGECFAFLSDEWYTTAGRELPDYDSYGDFPQIENGVGLLRLFEGDMLSALMCEDPLVGEHTVSIAGGEAAHGFFVKSLRAFEPYGIHTELFAIHNDYFGGNVSVGGLITGGDLMRQLHGRLHTDTLLIPRNMLREREDVFLDGVTLEDVKQGLGVNVIPFGGGDELVDTIFGLFRAECK